MHFRTSRLFPIIIQFIMLSFFFFFSLSLCYNPTERQSHSYQLEYLFNYYVKMLQRHHKQLSLSKVWESVIRGLQIYPFSPELFGALLEIGHLYTTPNKLRWIFDDFCHK